MDTSNSDPIDLLCRELLLEIGEDTEREGLVKTPHRFAKAFRELTDGYHQSSEKLVNGAIFDHPKSEMVIVKDIEFYSLCEHHLLPFFGKASIAYIPKGKIIGLSKIPRIVNMFAKRLQVQERLTNQICEELQKILSPLGVGCSLEGYHMCMMMRGIQVQSSKMITTSLVGAFETNKATRQEFFDMIKAK